MKKCIKCEQLKNENEFHFKNKKIGKRKNTCKCCQKKYRKYYYNENRDRLIKYSIESSKKITLRNQQYLWDYLKNRPCIDCGNDNPIVLEFDHREEKITEVTKAAKNGWSIENIKKEIDKCDIRCANCHRIKTFNDFNWLAEVIK